MKNIGNIAIWISYTVIIYAIGFIMATAMHTSF